VVADRGRGGRVGREEGLDRQLAFDGRVTFYALAQRSDMALPRS
jgi:hypothetical protein